MGSVLESHNAARRHPLPAKRSSAPSRIPKCSLGTREGVYHSQNQMTATPNPLILALGITAFAVTTAAIIYHRPYFRGATILPAAGDPEVTKYSQEFADSLSISTHWNTGKPLPKPRFYLRGGDASSPDGQFTLRQRELRNDYHEITLSRGQSDQREVVLVLQEGDPGSGTSHNWQWSHDSRAVFIYGSGTPAGHAHTNNLALIYLVELRTLYSIDLKHLSRPRTAVRGCACPGNFVAMMPRPAPPAMATKLPRQFPSPNWSSGTRGERGARVSVLENHNCSLSGARAKVLAPG